MRETTNTRQASALRGARQGKIGRFRAACLSGDWSAPFNPEASSYCQGRRGIFEGGDYSAGRHVWPVWVSPDYSSFKTGGFSSQPQSGGEDLAAGGSQGSEETTEAGSFVGLMMDLVFGSGRRIGTMSGLMILYQIEHTMGELSRCSRSLMSSAANVWLL